MISIVLGNISRFLVLMLLQVLVLDHVDLANGWMVLYLYVLFLLLLPFELPVWATLLIGAATGGIMDHFTNTPGMHMSACLVLTYARKPILSLLAPRDGYEFGTRPTIHDMGLNWFVTYAAMLVAIHHLWLFFVEMARFDDFLHTLVRALVSTAGTLVLCLLAQALAATSLRSR